MKTKIKKNNWNEFLTIPIAVCVISGMLILPMIIKIKRDRDRIAKNIDTINQLYQTLLNYSEDNNYSSYNKSNSPNIKMLKNAFNEIYHLNDYTKNLPYNLKSLDTQSEYINTKDYFYFPFTGWHTYNQYHNNDNIDFQIINILKASDQNNPPH